MLTDSFIETSVKRKNGFKEVFFNSFLIGIAIILVFMVNFIPVSLGYSLFYLTGIASFGIVAGVITLIKRQKKMYEIEMSNDIVDCAVILGDNKRDELISFSLKECEYIGPVTSDRYNRDKENANFVIKMTDFQNFDINDTYWYWCFTTESMKFVVVFMYKEDMYPVFRRYNPRATIPMAMIPKKAKEENDD